MCIVPAQTRSAPLKAAWWSPPMLEVTLKVNHALVQELPLTHATFHSLPTDSLPSPRGGGEKQKNPGSKSSLQFESWVGIPRNPGVFLKAWGPERGGHLPGQKSWPDYSKGSFCPGVLLLSPSDDCFANEWSAKWRGRKASLWIPLVRAPLPAAKTEHFKTKYSVCSISISVSVCLSHTQSHPYTYISWYK